MSGNTNMGNAGNQRKFRRQGGGRDGKQRKRDEPTAQDLLTVWVPKTELGRRVANGQVTSIDEVLLEGEKILEPEIVDKLLPELHEELIKLGTTQRTTDSGRKMKFRAVVVVGDGHGHVGIGAGKSDEARPAIENAVKSAKRNIISIPFGCGSWECGCGTKHSIPVEVTGKCGSVRVTLRPAPRGVGIVGNSIVRKVLTKAGLSDVWSTAKGHTSTKYNTAVAVYDALRKLSNMQSGRDWSEE
ncbi:MAG: 30S ribosomal protein S5 [Candidatus Micrarchaeota archaeon]|nr:30S ribosomal protein S5 [Candidatus Micrarchaeota archaeon]